MKNLFMIFGLLSSTSAFAVFFPVIAKNCNSKPAQVLNGERIFIDDSQQILGFGFSDQNCRLVDFTSYVIVSSSNADENIQAACAIGRKSTCTTDIGAYKGPNFQTAIIGPHSLHLQNVEGDCTDLSFQF